jgi:hypothetical protein
MPPKARSSLDKNPGMPIPRGGPQKP